MEDLQNYGDFPGHGVAIYPDLNPCYSSVGEPLYCELDSDCLDFDWTLQPLGSLSTNQPAKFATEPWPNQLDMSPAGNFEEPALLVDLEQPFFMLPTTFGQVQSSSFYTVQNVSVSSCSISSDSICVPSTRETPLPIPILQSPGTSGLPLHKCYICARSYPNLGRLRRHQKQHFKPVRCPESPTCTHRTAEKRDMDRHVSVYHPGHIKVPQCLCPETECKYAIKGFARRDHLNRHIRRMHRRLVP